MNISTSEVHLQIWHLTIEEHWGWETFPWLKQTIVRIHCAAWSAFTVTDRHNSAHHLRRLQWWWCLQNKRIMDNQGRNRQIKHQRSLDTQQVETVGGAGTNDDSGQKYTNTRQKWRDAMCMGYCRLRRNWHFYYTEASQVTWDITSGGTHYHPRRDRRCDVTCKGKLEDADHSPVRALSRTGRQIRRASRANAGVRFSIWLTIVSQTKSWHQLGSIDSLQSPSACEAEEMMPMTMAVASKVSEAENDKVLGRGADIQTLGATTFDDLPTSIEVVVVFAWQTGECVGLLRVSFEDITLHSPGDTDPSAGRYKQRAAAEVEAKGPLQGDPWMTAAGSPRYEGSGCTAGLGSWVGKPLMTRPPGYSLPPLPSFPDCSANIDGGVRRYSQQTNDYWKWTALFGMPKPYEAIGSTGTTSLQQAIIETVNWTDKRQYAHNGDARRWMTMNLWLWWITLSYVKIYHV